MQFTNLLPYEEARRIGVVTNDYGDVFARQYEGFSICQLGIAMWCASEWVLEVQVPPESLHDLPAGWKPREKWSPEVLKLREWLEPLRNDFDAKDRPASELSASELAPTELNKEAQGVHVPIAARRIRSEVRAKIPEKLTATEVALAKDVDLSGLEHRADILATAVWAMVRHDEGEKYILDVAVLRPKPIPTNVLEYLLEAECLIPIPDPEEMFEMFKLKGMNAVTRDLLFPPKIWVTLGRQPDLQDLVRQSQHLAGISKDGFDATFHTRKEGTLRIRNLGGGRIRVDAGTFGIYDPYFLIEFLSRAIAGD